MSVQGLDARTTRVFYPHYRGVLVTDRWFYAHGRRYAVQDLAQLGRRSGSVHVARWFTCQILAAETALAAVIVVAAGPSLLAVLSIAVYAVMASVSLWFSFRRWPTPLTLWADHRGMAVLLYASTDHAEFAKVYRALRRATELYEPIT
jgi:Family of unknown function (DUF6232)